MEENGVGYKLNKVQLTRIGEIFRPFFDELENTLISHIVYRVSFSRDFNPESGSFVRMYFTLSDEEGVQQDAWVVFNEGSKDWVWSLKKVKFDNSRLKELKKAFVNVIAGIDSIEINMGMVIVEAGTKWVFGTVVKDESKTIKHRKKTQDYILFLKSNQYFEDYALKKDGNSVHIDDKLLEDDGQV